MGWAELQKPADMGVGTTGEIEAAHKALDGLGVPPGKLAVRVVRAVTAVDQRQANLHTVLEDCTDLLLTPLTFRPFSPSTREDPK